MGVRPSPEELSGLLRGWLGAQCGGVVHDAEPPTVLSGGFDFWIYGLQFAGDSLPDAWRGPVVARIPPTPERFEPLKRESRLQSWAAASAYPAPGVVDLLAPGVIVDSPVQIVDRAAGVTMADAMAKAPHHITRMMSMFGSLHARLHDLPVPEWARSTPEFSILERRLSLVHFVLDRVSVPGLEEALTAVTALGPSLAVRSPVVCHGDFHPLNVLVAGTEPTVIDWTDAGVGDPHCDIARTAWVFRLGAMGAESRGQRGLLRAVGPYLSRAYLRSYRGFRPVEPRRIALWRPVHLLHAWAMFIADTHELTGPSRTARSAQLAGVIGEQCRAALAALN